jgi:hypothetical protein
MSDWRRRSFAAFLVPVLVMSVVLCSGCGPGGNDDDDDDNPPPGGQVVWPVDVGNVWTYEFSSGGPVETFTIEVTGTQQVSGVTVAKVEYTDSPFGVDYYVYVRNATGGLFFYGDNYMGELATPELWCKYPCSPGDDWQTSRPGVTIDWEIIAVSESVTVPDGTYNCIHLRGTPQGGGASADHWYHVGTGEVKMTSGALTIELASKDLQ